MFHDRQDQLLVHNEIVVHMDINKDVHYKSTNYLHLNRIEVHSLKFGALLTGYLCKFQS